MSRKTPVSKIIDKIGQNEWHNTILNVISVVSKDNKISSYNNSVDEIKKRLIDAFNDMTTDDFLEDIFYINMSDYNLWESLSEVELTAVLKKVPETIIDLSEKEIYENLYNEDVDEIIAPPSFWRTVEKIGSEPSKGCLIIGDTTDYLFLKTNELNGMVIPLRKLNLKYALKGDFRGEWKKVR